MPQRVRSLTAVAWVTVEVQVQSLVAQWVKVSHVAAATAMFAAMARIQSLAQDLPYTMAIKGKKERERGRLGGKEGGKE